MRATPTENKKAAMGYQNANQRPRCSNCVHSQQVVPSGAYNDVYPWRCSKGGFGVTAQAVCNQHQPYQPLQKGGAA
ncbi:MAG TPA: hypothetical protein PLE22_01430 [Acidovorax sp.]|nr:hypothetical protein [Acidovorax sp.]